MPLQHYSRTQQRTPHGAHPSGCFMPDGRFLLAMPTQAAASTQSPEPSNAVSGVTVVMSPAADAVNNGRLPVLLLLFADTVAILWLLSELSWRTVLKEMLLGLGVIGLLTDAVGAASAYRTTARASLHAFALATVIQVVCSVLMLQSVPQLVHSILQILLVRCSLLLYSARTPQWFSTGSRGGARR